MSEPDEVLAWLMRQAWKLYQSRRKGQRDDSAG